MPQEGSKPPPDESGSTVDSFLREIARAQARPPPTEPDPSRVAHFRIERRLGAGGMGVVYRAVDEKLERTVALKVLRGGFDSSPEHVRRFRREARSAAAIPHPNIAAVFEIGEADGHVFIAMELVEGQTLRACILDGLSITESLDIAKAIGRGLARAHEKGIVHRDLKPENVMVSGSGDAKILDFGLAKLLEQDVGLRTTKLRGEAEESVTQEGHIVGTPGYMSPEQAVGEIVDARTDVFSFGVMLYEMLTGTRPFRGATRTAIVLSAGRDTPRPPSELNPQAPADLDRVIARCLEKEKGARYADGGELLRALGAVDAGATGSLSGSTRANATGLSPSYRPRAPKSAGAQGRARWVWPFAAAVVAAPLVLFAARRVIVGLAPRTIGDTLSASSALPSEESKAIGLVDIAPPVTSNADAAAAYRRALTDVRDSTRGPQTSLQRAIQLDPDFAAAHLRLSMTKSPPSSTQEYREAVRVRERLDARDQAILRAEEPIGAGVPQDLPEAERRYTALSESRPKDVEILMRLGAIRESRDPLAARATFDKLIALAPTMPGAELAAGDNARLSDDLDLAQRHYERCIELSPTATRCLSRVAFLRASRGHCDSFAKDVTRILVLEPKEWFFRLTGLSAALSTGAADDTVNAALDAITAQGVSLRGEHFDREELTGEVALWRGSMIAARDRFVEAEKFAQEKMAPTALSWTFHQQLTVAEEIGDEPAATRLLRSFLGARALTTENDLDSIALRGLRRHQVVPLEELRRVGERWRKDATNEPEALLWLQYDAALALTEGEARGLLASGMAAKLGHDNLRTNAQLGHLLLLGHEFKEAANRLVPVASNCAVLSDDTSNTPWIIRAAYDLGQAREQLGDVAGACGAYRRVLDQWGSASPRSETASAAASRARTLHCSG
jgi:eukaryotic-like serine/threonine-protein kinase